MPESQKYTNLPFFKKANRRGGFTSLFFYFLSLRTKSLSAILIYSIAFILIFLATVVTTVVLESISSPIIKAIYFNDKIIVGSWIDRLMFFIFIFYCLTSCYTIINKKIASGEFLMLLSTCYKRKTIIITAILAVLADCFIFILFFIFSVIFLYVILLLAYGKFNIVLPAIKYSIYFYLLQIIFSNIFLSIIVIFAFKSNTILYIIISILLLLFIIFFVPLLSLLLNVIAVSVNSSSIYPRFYVAFIDPTQWAQVLWCAINNTSTFPVPNISEHTKPHNIKFALFPIKSTNYLAIIFYAWTICITLLSYLLLVRIGQKNIKKLIIR